MECWISWIRIFPDNRDLAQLETSVSKKIITQRKLCVLAQSRKYSGSDVRVNESARPNQTGVVSHLPVPSRSIEYIKPGGGDNLRYNYIEDSVRSI